MEDKKMEIITVKDIDYAILDEIDDYIYTVNVNDGNDVKIFKIDEDNESIEELNYICETLNKNITKLRSFN